MFFDGSAYYFDDYLRLLTGPYRLMYGTVNGHPHYVARGCKEPGQGCFNAKLKLFSNLFHIFFCQNVKKKHLDCAKYLLKSFITQFSNNKRSKKHIQYTVCALNALI